MWMRGFLALCLLLLGSGPAWAACSSTTLTATVASGGTATFECSDFGFAIFPPITPPSHGSLSEGTPTNVFALIYTNNGDGALSDTFQARDYDTDLTVTFNITVLPASSPLTVSPASLPTPNVGAAYSQTLTTTGGTAPYSYVLNGGTLPPGLSLSAGGTISGTPTASGPHTFSIHVTDSTSGTPLATDKSYTVNIPAPVLDITPDAPPNAAQSVPYNLTFTGSGGTAPYTFSIESGSLPPGLSMNSSGVVSGTPTTLGSYTFSLKLDDSTTISTGGDHFIAQSVTITVVAAPTIVVNPATLPAATIGTAYSQAATASGGTAPYSFLVSAGTLPAGLALSSTGTLSGTPTAAGTFNFTIRATDANSFTGTRAYALVVNAPTISVAPATLPNATVATAYNQAITASGGTSTYAFAVTAGALPAGLTLSSTGVLSGTPTAGGSFNFTVTATDSSTGTGAPFTGSRAYSLVVAAPTISLAPATLPNATVASAYSQTVTASGGTAPYSFAVTAGALPPGLALGSTGALSGTPTASGSFNFTVTATDSSSGTGAYTGSRAYTLQVINIAPIANPVSATVAYGSGANPITLNITGGVPTSVAVGTAPAHGTAIASGTSITYQPTAGYAGPDSFTYTATNAEGTSAPATVTITVSNPTITITPSAPLTAQVGTPYSQTFTWSGGTAPYNGVSVTGMPAGLSVTAIGSDSVTISGTPTAAGSFTVNASATDSSTGTGPFTTGQDFALTVSAPTLAMTPAPGTLVAPYGVAYNQSFSTSGGTAPYSYSLTAGALPVGMSLSSTGILSGTPTVPGLYALTIRATDSSLGTGAPFSVSNNYVLQVSAPTISFNPATVPDGTAGTAYNATANAEGGVAPYSYSLLAGALPIGMSFSSAGVLSGVPRSDGSFSLTIRATDANGQAGQQVFTFTIAPATLVVSPATLPGGTAGVAYSQSLSTSGGIAPYSYSILSGSLPVGMSFSSAGVFSGTPVVAGTYNVSIRSTDDAGYNATVAYSIVIGAPTIAITPTTLPDGVFGTPYNASLVASGGTAPYSFSLLSGSLPVGMSFSSAGAFAGTPSVPGSYSFVVRATDALGFNASQSYTLVIADALPVANDVGLTVAYDAAATPVTLNVTGGAPTSVAIGTAPGHGTAIASGTNITYQPAAGYAGADSFTYMASNTAGTSAPATVTVSVGDPVISVAASGPLTAQAGVAYSQTFTWTGGAAPYSGFQVTNLPAGLSVTATTANSATVSGTPIEVGSFALAASATDGSSGNGPFTTTGAFTLTVTAPTLAMTPAPGALALTYATPYSQNFIASGSPGPYDYAVTGPLPAGMTFSGGTLSGTPTVPGSYAITVTATDTTLTGAGAPFSIAQNYTVDVSTPAIVVTPATLPGTTAGLAYNQGLSADGGVAPYAFAVTTGAVPGGLTLGADGALAGTATTSGSFNFTVTATDANGQTGSRAYAVTVAVPTLTLTPATLADGTAGTPYSQVLTISGGIAPYTVVQTGALPAGLTFDATTRTFSGTPTQSGTFAITVTATDSTAGTAATVSGNYTLTIVAPALTLSPASLPAASAGIGYEQTFVASGGIAPYAYTVSGGALPAGMTLDASTGALAGTPTVAGTFNFSVTATDSTTGTAGTVTNAYTITVSAPTITVNPPVLPAGIAGVPYTHVLNAVGGTAPHAFAVTAGALPAGLTLASDGRITGEPGVGTFEFTVTATDALGFTGARTYSVQVVQRPDPSRDPEVRGLLEAQSDSARRFASAQMGNFQQRLENLHDNREGAQLSNRLSFAVSQSCVDYMGRKPGEPCGNAVASSGAVASASAAGAADGDGDEGATQASANSPFSAWIGGIIRSGNQDGRGGGAGADFETDGVSIGADYRINRAFVLGAGLGYGRDESDVGDNGSRVEGDAYAMVLYASYHPGDRYFLDALAGYQRLSYDLRRYVTASDGLVEGSRDGRQWFGSVSAGAQFQHDTWQLTPYARIDVSRASLDAYVEQGDPIYSLAYGEQDVDATTGNIGLRFESRHATTWGAFAPQVRLEYQHDFNGDSSATMQYADLLTGPVYRADLQGFDRNRFMLGLGAMFYLPRDFSLRAEYRGLFGNGGDKDNGVMLGLEKSY